jgi:hypothetical protein
MIKNLIIFSFFLLLSFFSNAQISNIDSSRTRNLLSDGLKVYMDIGNCNYCDFTFIRKEINYVNYVRDPKESQVQVIITETSTGSGGKEFNLMFIGKKEFNGNNDTLKQACSVNNTFDENRIEIVRNLKMGLMRYVMKTPSNILIEINTKNYSAENEKVEDKWKSWVYNLNLSGYGNGEKNYNQLQLWYSASASKVTPNWKINFYASGFYKKSKYIFDDTTIIRTYQRSYDFGHSAVKSIGNHWSTGYFYTLINNTYNNVKLINNLKLGIEYNIFPYDKSASKLITFRYKIGGGFNQYIDTSIYDKINELLLNHSIGMGVNYITKWGSANAALVYSNYLYDFNKNNLNFYSNVNVRLFKGLSLSCFLYLSIIHDQLSLPKEGATYEEVLLQQHQLATQYSYNFNFGITYTFGSIYNNIVNPRFDY